MTWLWTIVSLLVAGGLLGVLYDFFSGRRAERRELRKEGAAVVTPVTELIEGSLGPEATLFGSDEQIEAHFRDVHRRWWDERRPVLLQYANQHPRRRVRRLARELVDAFGSSLASTRFFFHTRNTAETMEPFHAARKNKNEALAKAEELMAEIRRAWPRCP